jgi:hypothetical protein
LVGFSDDNDDDAWMHMHTYMNRSQHYALGLPIVFGGGNDDDDDDDDSETVTTYLHEQFSTLCSRIVNFIA